MSEIKVSNARIRSANITVENHGILDAWVMLEWAGGGQGFGGWCLAGGPHCAIFLVGVLRAAGVERWSDLAGCVVRIRHEEFGRIHAIGHAITDDCWFDPSAEFARVKAAK